jgi:hypothetical protein
MLFTKSFDLFDVQLAQVRAAIAMIVFSRLGFLLLYMGFLCFLQGMSEASDRYSGAHYIVCFNRFGPCPIFFLLRSFYREVNKSIGCLFPCWQGLTNVNPSSSMIQTWQCIDYLHLYLGQGWNTFSSCPIAPCSVQVARLFGK